MHTTYMALLLALGLSVATRLASAQTTSSQELVKQGVALYDQGKPDEAVLRYKEALKQDPANTTARYELALTYNALGRNEEAVALSKQILKQEAEPGPSIYSTYGNALDGLKKPKEAAKVYQEGLKRYPNDGALHFNLGVTQATALNQPAEAIGSMQQSVRCRPGHANSLNALALLQQQEGNRVPALLAMLRLLQMEPTGQRAEAVLARFDKLLGRGVEKTGEKAVTIDISPETLKNAGKKGRPDNFSAADMLLSMSGAMDYSEENKDKTPTEQLIRKLDALISVLDELHPEKQEGFTWQYLVPYFVELKKQGYLPALAYAVQESRATRTPEVQTWLANHTATVEEFRSWSAAYAWPK
ncbi:tetratricopeptide repeat protein [Hymenobacter perfusus]|uniref:Tetratricopeptide repeat protein n=1 Tax=Hymenobacter perfusus TaxID=1236770 RepID=A0A3R9P3A9_9BACT|nr:tetratricopeptide repeat protein [Hymenobacter perfusus]RSK43322.1 tetratricopeptide repeat protein [Hymenobacter perfusus]